MGNKNTKNSFLPLGHKPFAILSRNTYPIDIWKLEIPASHAGVQLTVLGEFFCSGPLYFQFDNGQNASLAYCLPRDEGYRPFAERIPVSAERDRTEELLHLRMGLCFYARGVLGELHSQSLHSGFPEEASHFFSLVFSAREQPRHALTFFTEAPAKILPDSCLTLNGNIEGSIEK